jgi:phosphopantothenoylcysteine decarboxylase / phosphopantothenate---cysteine ligase
VRNGGCVSHALAYTVAMAHIIVIISGSIAAYKALEVIRELRRAGHTTTAVMTAAAREFITPLSVSALTSRPTYSDLFSLTDETEMGHIRLAREADLILIVPASANIIARMACGMGNDLATNLLLAADMRTTPIVAAPAMNPHMWQHPSVMRNLAQLIHDGVQIIPPEKGEMACGEMGIGRLAEVSTIVAQVGVALQRRRQSGGLAGKRVIVTAGATREPIDAVRFISNHSSGKQAAAIAHVLYQQGAEVVLVHGAIQAAVPAGVQAVSVTHAASMLDAVEQCLPADAVICAAAVADWRVEVPSAQKMKKEEGVKSLQLTLTQTPDILAHVAKHSTKRPPLVIGFAAETDEMLPHAIAKRKRKGCDWILTNDVTGGAVFGADDTAIHFITAEGIEDWGFISKQDAAERLCAHMVQFFKEEV